MRKIYFILIILVLGVTGMAYLYFSNLNKESSASDSALNMVTANAPIIFTFDNEKGFYDILSKQQVTNEILGSEKSDLLSILQESLTSNSSINQLIEKERIIIGFLPGNANKVDFILATQTKAKDFDIKILNQINATVKPEGNLYHVNFGDSAQCYVAIINQSFFLSNTKETLKKIAETKVDKNDFKEYIQQNNRFNKNTLASVFINYNQLPTLLKNILNTNLTGELSIFNKQNAYASLSYNFGSDKFLLNGYTEIKDDQNYFNLFVDQKEQKINIDQFFPDQTANYTLFAVDDYTKWTKALKDWQKERKEDVKIAQQHKEINEKYRINIDQTFPLYFSKQFAVLQLKSGEKLGIIETKNGDKLNQLLLDLSTEYAPDIRIFKEANLMGNFFGEPFKKFERPFYTVIDNHFVFASYASTIQVFLNSYKNDNLLISTDNYIRFKDQTSSSATIAFYINHQNSNDIFGRNLKTPYYKQYKSEKGVKEYNAFGYQLSADNGKFMSNILLLKKQSKIEIDSLTNTR
ncbi:MAG: hypothetical protein REI64_00380 [Pedobacter sp.]|uniref:hypothetical protein n=1 Tax=Pedobacter sp. TaxID=1411316 RepID=UPI00280A34AC|nr:hypothetical protein [Pedobacter sp.]MDQ8003217.1 hypothetical protein [Pedobacter sp.]